MRNVTVTSSSGFKQIECLLCAVAASIPDFTAAPNDMHGNPWDLMSLFDTEKLGFEVTVMLHLHQPDHPSHSNWGLSRNRGFEPYINGNFRSLIWPLIISQFLAILIC